MGPRITAATVFLFTAGIASAEPDKDKIKRSIQGGQDYLRAVYRPGGPGPGGFPVGGGGGLRMMIPAAAMGAVGGTGMGSAALAGLALLESGAGRNDAAVVNITRVCREAAPHTTSTYEIALFIMSRSSLILDAECPR